MVTVSRLNSATFFDGEEGDWDFSLNKLSVSDRQSAEKWIQEAGPGAFFRIARVVAASKGKGRPRLESEVHADRGRTPFVRQPQDEAEQSGEGCGPSSGDRQGLAWTPACRRAKPDELDKRPAEGSPAADKTRPG